MPDTDGKHPNLQHYTPESSETHHNNNYVHQRPSKDSVKASVDSMAASRGVSVTKEEKQRYYSEALKKAGY